MKKCIALTLIMLLAMRAARADALPKIGVLIYNASDTFISTVLESIEHAAEGKAELYILDSENSQILQNAQLESLLSSGVDALIINAVDRTSAVYLIRMVKPHGIPIVFNNREPLYEDLIEYDKAYYVGNNPTESGRMSGELIANYVKAHPEVDKNGDGILQYVMFKGEPGHQDAELRTVYSVKALKDAGIALEKLQESTAMWDRTMAQEKMSSFIASFGDRIECVLSNNDDMALGAIDALKAAGHFSNGRYTPVVGVDATDPAIEALKSGTLLGTVLNDAQAQGDAALTLALMLSKGTSLEDFPYEIERGAYVWIPSKLVTRKEVP